MPDVLKAISSVRGVERVDSHLEPHEMDDRVPGLRGRPPLGTEPRRREWSPTAKLAVGLAGTTLASVGMLRHDKLGMVLGGVGLALLLRSVGGHAVLAPSARPSATEDTAQGVRIPVKFGPRAEGQPPGEPWPGPQAPGRVH
jgi:hypothetical protein